MTVKTALQVAGRIRSKHHRNRTAVLLPILLCCAIFAAGCAHRTYQTQAPAPVPQPPVASQPSISPPSGPPPAVERQPAKPGEFVEEGVASWYGPTFNGRRTSDGEIYDMHDFTAAHRTLPFNAIVRVTNMSNGLQTEVRINDRGPFVANRIIDLSLSAAKAIQMVGPGTAQVRLEMLSGPDPDTGFFAVQVGAFRMEENADRLRDQLAQRYSPVSTVPFNLPTGHLYRVRVGHLATEAAAHELAGQLREAGLLVTFVVRLEK